MIPGFVVHAEVGGVLICSMPSSRPDVPPHGFYWGYQTGQLYCECEGFVCRRLTATLSHGGCRHCRAFAVALSTGPQRGED